MLLRIKEKLSHIYILQGKKQIDVEKLVAGDIGAFSNYNLPPPVIPYVILITQYYLAPLNFQSL